jgi:putative transposase
VPAPSWACTQGLIATTRGGDNAAIRRLLRELANERRRFGYRRLHIMLRREGVELNHKKLFRLYHEERLTVRRRGARLPHRWRISPLGSAPR